ncbi:putative secreted protein (type I secretion substrate) [Acinetobacter calcoaceticus]|uniref:Putative secreted protein (Type I secretion substrate) n=1 Tax=Acinetobacter calcoaceticus TaxID=471 RepID=A0A4R1XT08_ACICA|nr:putative secreted protein (type I secretion substrate) [Acinetobacter calcoaceticus]
MSTTLTQSHPETLSMPLSVTAQRAVQSVIDLHDLIQTVFSSADSEQQLQQLLQYFSADYEMIGVSGKLLQTTQLQALFTQNMGSMPDFKIEIDDIAVIFESDTRVMLRYREQQDKQGSITQRLSTALIEMDAERCVWRFLHETSIPSV